MKSEFLIPLWYTIKRDMIRQNNTVVRSTLRFFSSMLRDYVWIPIYVFWTVEGLGSLNILGAFLHLIAFSIAYEIGYIYADNIGIKREKITTRNVVYEEPVPDKEIYLSMIIRLVVLSVLLFIMQAWLNYFIVLLYAMGIFIFILHAHLTEKLRIFTFIGLRFNKGFIPYAFLIFLLAPEEIWVISFLLLGISIFYSISYASRKLELRFINVYEPKYFWLRFLLTFLLAAPAAYFSRYSLEKFSWMYGVFTLTHLVIIGFSQISRLINNHNTIFQKFFEAGG
ncbi:hypothetical protein RM545_06190 [Zunongwangia sp. F260]|uniref:Uncharacterized protein n=1 Tax=Autumnicola lenta TaxID=3075593 RepID=A0ABU3CJ67_9FLAO|nr:hypothetical protein [Zunongwangia sp. F260]MDT0646273.1 hypothetical protein [Zunongwangia sp. F260]